MFLIPVLLLSPSAAAGDCGEFFDAAREDALFERCLASVDEETILGECAVLIEDWAAKLEECPKWSERRSRTGHIFVLGGPRYTYGEFAAAASEKLSAVQRGAAAEERSRRSFQCLNDSAMDEVALSACQGGACADVLTHADETCLRCADAGGHCRRDWPSYKAASRAVADAAALSAAMSGTGGDRSPLQGWFVSPWCERDGTGVCLRIPPDSAPETDWQHWLIDMPLKQPLLEPASEAEQRMGDSLSIRAQLSHDKGLHKAKKFIISTPADHDAFSAHGRSTALYQLSPAADLAEPLERAVADALAGFGPAAARELKFDACHSYSGDIPATRAREAGVMFIACFGEIVGFRVDSFWEMEPAFAFERLLGEKPPAPMTVRRGADGGRLRATDEGWSLTYEVGPYDGGTLVQKLAIRTDVLTRDATTLVADAHARWLEAQRVELGLDSGDEVEGYFLFKARHALKEDSFNADAVQVDLDLALLARGSESGARRAVSLRLYESLVARSAREAEAEAVRRGAQVAEAAASAKRLACAECGRLLPSYLERCPSVLLDEAAATESEILQCGESASNALPACQRCADALR